ncbi:MAG: mechanosensitive ion channel family protein [Candidatus Omnitrophota bacterium]|jgi:small conductance mechanosensitive channel
MLLPRQKTSVQSIDQETFSIYNSSHMDILYTNALVIVSELGLLFLAGLLIKILLQGIVKICINLPVFKAYQECFHAVERQGIRFLQIILFCAVGGTLLINGVLVYLQKDLLTQVHTWMSHVSPHFWIDIIMGVVKSLILAGVVYYGIKKIHALLMIGMARAKAYQQIKANDESIEIAFRTLDTIQQRALWMGCAYATARFLLLPATAASFLLIILKIYLYISLGLLVVKAVAAIIDSLDALSAKYQREDNLLRYYDQLRGLIPLMRRCLEYIIYITVATLVSMQVEFIARFAEYGPLAIQMIGIFFLSRVAVEVVYLFIDNFILKTKDITGEVLQRHLTLIPLIKSLFKYIIYFVAFVLILKTFRLNPTPILAGAGIVGVVVGLGAQPLINDLVSGFFIIFENLFLVGDYIETGNASGTVEAIDIRTTRLRHLNGQLFILRNGQINEIVNYSKKYIYAVVEVGVAYESDLNRVYATLEETGKILKAENPNVLEPTLVSGLKKFGESELTIRTITKVKPGTHLTVSCDLRKRIKEAFDRNNIEIPYARRVLIIKNDAANPLS